tara:strand:- start:347 stop:793 length:447 start_codon:yes stop_codon:yes gene_type:complete
MTTYSSEQIVEILSNAGMITPLRQEFKIEKHERYKNDFKVIGTGKIKYDFQGDSYREIIPNNPITLFEFTHGASWLDEDALLVCIFLQNGDEEQFKLENISSLSCDKLSQKIAIEILKKTSKVEFEDNFENDEEALAFYTDENNHRMI